MSRGSRPLSGDMLETVARRFRLLGEPIRLQLLQILEPGERSVSEITAALGGNQSNVSRHLSALHEVGILLRRREGTNVYYSIGDPVVFQLCELMCNSAREQMRIRLESLDPSRHWS